MSFLVLMQFFLFNFLICKYNIQKKKLSDTFISLQFKIKTYTHSKTTQL